MSCDETSINTIADQIVAAELAIRDLNAKLADLRERRRKILANQIIAKFGLTKAMVADSKAEPHIMIRDSFVSFVRNKMPSIKWYEWNGDVHHIDQFWTREYVDSNPLRYDDLT